jgi:hypothetical protein
MANNSQYPAQPQPQQQKATLLQGFVWARSGQMIEVLD